MLILNITIWFIIYFLIIIAISFVSNRTNKQLSDYMLGSRHLSGRVTALGVGASDMSGWLLLGLPGAIFVSGLSNVFLPLGLVLGAFLVWRILAKRLRVYTEFANDSLTLPAYLDNRFDDQSGIIRFVTATTILIFFTCYAAAGFVAGAVLFSSIFSIDYYTALFISAALTILYTSIGGFLAVNRIDFFQGTLMFAALLVVPITTIYLLGGWINIFEDLQIREVGYLSVTHDLSYITMFSLLAWGLGYFGQPHILVRFMAIESAGQIKTARRIHLSWMITALLGAILTGLIGRYYYTIAGLANPESVFLQLVYDFFFPAQINILTTFLGSILLAAVLSAIMSTIAAQLLASASALTEDIYHRFLKKNASQTTLIKNNRIMIVIVGLAAILLAKPESTILELVSYAWAGLGAAFGPVILLSLYWQRMTRTGAVAGIISGGLTVIVWEILPGFFPDCQILTLYSIIPGFILSIITSIALSLITAQPSENVKKTFIKVQNQLTTL